MKNNGSIKRRRGEDEVDFRGRVVSAVRKTGLSAMIEGVEHCALCAEGSDLSEVTEVKLSGCDCYNCGGNK